MDLQESSRLLRCLNALGCSSAYVPWIDGWALPIPVGAVAGRLPRVKVSTMISVLVTFQYGDDFDHERVAKVAAEAHTMFEGMPGLRSKAFTVNDAARCAQNFYVWDDERAGQAFFSDALRERVTGLYGVAPSVAFGEVLELVENTRSQ